VPGLLLDWQQMCQPLLLPVLFRLRHPTRRVLHVFGLPRVPHLKLLKKLHYLLYLICNVTGLHHLLPFHLQQPRRPLQIRHRYNNNLLHPLQKFYSTVLVFKEEFGSPSCSLTEQFGMVILQSQVSR
jgi:hypothetical protein